RADERRRLRCAAGLLQRKLRPVQRIQHLSRAVGLVLVQPDEMILQVHLASSAWCGSTSTIPARMARFISVTAWRKPTYTARLMMACPMCNSATPASAAIGPTL